MNFRIDKGRFSVATSGDSLRVHSGNSDTERIKELLAKRPRSSENEAPDALKEEELSKGQNAVISKIQRKLARANDAVDATIFARQQLLYLAREGASLPHLSERHKLLNEEADSYATEILRILRTGEGSPDFVELTKNNSYGVNDITTETSASVSTGAIPLQQGLTTSRITNAKTAAQFAAATERTIGGLRSFEAGYEAAQKKAENLTPKPVKEALPVQEKPRDTLSSVEEAKDLASSIANRIGKAGTDGDAAELIEAAASNLDYDRIRDLLG